MKLGKNRIHFLIMLFAVLSLLVHVPSDAYANDGGTITEVDSLEHDAANGRYNSLVQVDSDTYALAYSGEGEDGFISTFTISSDGTITAVKTQSLGNNLEHDTTSAIENSLVQVDSDTYALAYTGDGSDGFISTFTIPSDGSSITEVDSLEHDTALGYYNSLVQVDSDTYALAYAELVYDGAGRDGHISTFTISVTVTLSGETKKSGSECNDCTAPSIGISQIVGLIKITITLLHH